MIGALTTLLGYQLAGEIVVHLLALPVPGPVVGMVLLFLSLWARGSAPEPLRDTASGMLQHFSLLFVPAGVGVMVHLQRVSGEVWPILVAVLASTALAIAVSALAMQWLIRMRHAAHGDAER
ncbi:MAG: CidA/LrgA family protein [Betaproteobacteria bacterium]|nr:CidA/LrgA family protein [Betaproteobacteria bacterium]